MIADAIIGWVACGTLAVFLLNVADGANGRIAPTTMDLCRFALGPITLFLAVAAVGTVIGRRMRK